MFSIMLFLFLYDLDSMLMDDNLEDACTQEVEIACPPGSTCPRMRWLGDLHHARAFVP